MNEFGKGGIHLCIMRDKRAAGAIVCGKVIASGPSLNMSEGPLKNKREGYQLLPPPLPPRAPP